MEIKFYRDEESRRGCVSVWREGPTLGRQPDIDGYYEPGSGYTGGICGATEDEADQIATYVNKLEGVGLCVAISSYSHM